MTELFALEMGRNALMMTVMLAAPMMAAALVVGLLISVFQALTQINEQTLTFVPKILAVFAALLVAAPWLLHSLVGFAPGQEIASLTAAYVTFYVLAATRVLAAITFNPLLGSARVPMLGRVGIGLFATLVLFPIGGPYAAPAQVGPLELGGELMVGLLAGFGITLIFGAISFMGGLIGINSGFSFAQTINPMFDQHNVGGGVV